MATHTGGNKPGGLHAGVASEQAHSTTRFNGKDVPQFAPNYSVYVLPPDAVCFYCTASCFASSRTLSLREKVLARSLAS
jgi:hypothetical protein